MTNREFQMFLQCWAWGILVAIILILFSALTGWDKFSNDRDPQSLNQIFSAIALSPYKSLFLIGTLGGFIGTGIYFFKKSM